jgi:2-dehydro-3-deoxyphosphogluconate aldolase/(4S)-4-hydroxy-2-oxoglutarate aldolase
MNTVLREIGKYRIVPAAAIDDAGDAEALGEALVSGGLPIAEIMFRTSAAEASIRSLARRKDLLVGAGTVLNVDTVKRAVDVGASFIVSPGFNPKVVGYCVEQNIPIIPGIATPTEIEMALDHGLSVVKFFPAESMGGIKSLKVISAPYGMVQFMPTGGIGPENLSDYLRFPKVLACGGSWMVAKDLIAGKRFDRIRELSREAVEMAKKFTTL